MSSFLSFSAVIFSQTGRVFGLAGALGELVKTGSMGRWQRRGAVQGGPKKRPRIEPAANMVDGGGLIKN